MAVGVWTLIEKTDYISLLPSKTYAASAYILVLAGVIVMVTGVLGCCATFKEHRRLLCVVRDQVTLESETMEDEKAVLPFLPMWMCLDLL